MATYTVLSKVLLPTGLDEFGFNVSLNRLESESLDDYRRRLLLEVVQPSGASFEHFSRAVSRKVALFDTPAVRFELVLDGDDLPVAPDPLIVVTATKLYAYSDYGNSTIDVEVNLVDREDGWFIQDVVDAFAGNTFFTVSLLDADFAYKKSSHLSVGSNLRHKEILKLQAREVYDFGLSNLREVLFGDPVLFNEEVATVEDIEEYGQYYLDRIGGVVFTYSSMGGGAHVEYAEFPFDVLYRSVRAYEFKDEDVKYIIYDDILAEGSEDEQPLLLNSVGAEMVNELLATHPLEWGE